MITRKSTDCGRPGRNWNGKLCWVIFVYFVCVLWCDIPSFAQFRDLSVRLEDGQCGTSEDPNYRAAFYAFHKAAEICFLDSSGLGIFYPNAVDNILDAAGDPAFYYEGSVSWLESADDLEYHRIMKKSKQIDVTFEAVNVLHASPPIFEEEENVVHLSKDYAGLLHAFQILAQDVAFIYECDKAFLHRRSLDFKNYFVSGLFSHAVPLGRKDLAEWKKQVDMQYIRDMRRIETGQKKAAFYCKKSLDYCIAHHHNPVAHLHRGLFDYLDGNIVDALDQINMALKVADEKDLSALKDKALLLKGRTELETGLYADAILTLSELIDKNPKNKEAYFERANAYFELGEFDLSLKDYLISEIRHKTVEMGTVEVAAFSLGISRGLIQGGAQAGIEFIPSLLSSLEGIGHGLWAFAQDPVHVSIEFVQAARDCINFIKEHSAQAILVELAPEFKQLVENWDQLQDEKRGEITGHIIGKYGVDIFAGAGLVKAMKFCRELRRANHLLTFEAMAISERNKSIIKLEAVKRKQTRKEVLQRGNLKIQEDKQGKHLISHKNFNSTERKSILEHPDPQKLVDEYAGKGIRFSNETPGVPGYQEIVNFEEFIGYDVNRDNGQKIATTWGKIHYAKDGVHIVPTRPR